MASNLTFYSFHGLFALFRLSHHCRFSFRRNFFFPNDQISVHRYFDTEVEYLDNIFPAEDGGANVLGVMTGSRWYLYTLDRGILPHRSEQTLGWS